MRVLILMFTAAALFAAEKGFVPMKWQPSPGSWVTAGGVLSLKDRTDGKMRNEFYLWSEKTYGNFVMELDFKVVANTNSGVFIRTSNVKDPVQTGIEIQVASSTPGKPLSKGSVGGIYDLSAPTSNPLKFNGWNRMVITSKGPLITIALNGKKVSEANLDRWTEAQKNPDGTKNKFKRPLREFAREGYIGLQDHGTPVWYRNIRVKNLK